MVVGVQIQKTMLIQAFMPYIQVVMLYVLKFLPRYLDSKLSMFKKIPKTKCVTIQQYINVYAGPEVSIHFRYSSFLNLVFVTCTYGLAIPMLFPITLVGILNIYVVERAQFAYFYRKPPMFDNHLNNRALTFLKKGPLLLLCFSYWLLGNRQMFFNEGFQKEYQNDIIDPEHSLFDYSKGINATLFVLAFIPFFIFEN